jgi:hypothetical protein
VNRTLRLMSRGWMTLVAVGLAFVAGSMTRGRAIQASEASTQGRVYQLMIYHTVPGQAAALESLFRDSSKLQGKYLHVLGYWVPTDEPWKDTFIYLVAHPSREAAESNWRAFHSNPAFPPYRAAAIPLIKHDGDHFQVDEIYMRPSDFSALK